MLSRPGTDAAHLYHQSRRSNPDKFQRDDSIRMLKLLANVPASLDGEGVPGQDFVPLENTSRSSVKGSSDGIGGIIEHSAGEGLTPALGIYETGQGQLTAALSEPETAAEKDDLGRSRPWIASLPGPISRSGKIGSGREAMKMKLSDAPELPLSELRIPSRGLGLL